MAERGKHERVLVAARRKEDVSTSQVQPVQFAVESTCHIKIVWKIPFIFPTDAHSYTNRRILKQLKIITFAPTCFGSRRNHHQGAVLCLAKTTKYFICARRYRRSQCYGGM